MDKSLHRVCAIGSQDSVQGLLAVADPEELGWS